jgi:glycosyltransferase involved in cell wall biosynthesis
MRFSLIVPVYNCNGALPACVESIQHQTLDDFELLLVDDGSIDGSGALCDLLASRDDRIRVFHKENGGASSARNLGLKHADSEYILFIDGDDTIEPNLLEQISLNLSAAAPQMLIFGMAFDYYSDAGRLVRTNDLSVKHSGSFSADELLTSFSEFFNDNALSSACNKVFSGVILRENGLLFSENMTLYEDLDFVLRYLLNCDQITCMDRVFYHYRLPLQSPHVNKRVLVLEDLQHNLAQLSQPVLSLRSQNAAQRTADLCAELYDMHLMTASYSPAELSRAVMAMRDSTFISSFSQIGISPSDSASPSWTMIRDGSVRELYFSLMRRKLIRKAKFFVKAALKKAGFYH